MRRAVEAAADELCAADCDPRLRRFWEGKIAAALVEFMERSTLEPSDIAAARSERRKLETTVRSFQALCDELRYASAIEQLKAKEEGSEADAAAAQRDLDRAGAIGVRAEWLLGTIMELRGIDPDQDALRPVAYRKCGRMEAVVAELLEVMAAHDLCGVADLSAPLAISERSDRPRKRSATTVLFAALEPLFAAGECYEPKQLAKGYARPLIEAAGRQGDSTVLNFPYEPPDWLDEAEMGAKAWAFWSVRDRADRWLTLSQVKRMMRGHSAAR